MGLLFRFRESPFLSALRVVTMVLNVLEFWETSRKSFGRNVRRYRLVMKGDEGGTS